MMESIKEVKLMKCKAFYAYPYPSHGADILSVMKALLLVLVVVLLRCGVSI
tara:strand:- start:374 stop:526 length:153 start_codon:yes stop_codon:yes gene_type:complete